MSIKVALAVDLLHTIQHKHVDKRLLCLLQVRQCNPHNKHGDALVSINQSIYLPSNTRANIMNSAWWQDNKAVNALTVALEKHK